MPRFPTLKSNLQPQNTQYRWISLLLIALCLFVTYFSDPSTSYAAEATVGEGKAKFEFFEGGAAILTPLEKQSQTAMTDVTRMVRNTFFLLAVIELAWSAAVWAFQKDELTGFTSELIQKIMFIS